MNNIMANTKTEKGLQYLNQLSLLAVLVFLVLLQTFAIIFGTRWIIYVSSICFSVLNCAYYVVG